MHNEEKKTGIMFDVQSTPGQNEHDEEIVEDMTAHATIDGHERVHMIDGIDRGRLLFLVFSILKKLGGDERPEVRNSAIRTLFQTLGSHGHKLSSNMWEDCLWNYVFPILDNVTHLAATSSRDEWQGKELGMRGGKAVHMLIHHSRNTAQKQWDETLVLVLGGIARILRSFFLTFKSLNNFWAGWESLLLFVRNSISNGSKEVVLAAISCLQTTVLTHCPKGNLPMPYLKSVLDVYEFILQRTPNYNSNAASKVMQEILHSLGDLYVQAQKMFDNDMYLQLLEIVNFAMRHPKSTSDNLEAEYGNIPPLQRTMLEIIPLLRPTENLSSMWSHLLRWLLSYLAGSEAFFQVKEADAEVANSINHSLELVEMGSHPDISSVSKMPAAISEFMPRGTQKLSKSDFPNGTAGISQSNTEDSGINSVSATFNDAMVGISSHLLGEKLVLILVDLFLHAPSVERCNISPEIIQGLGRCMSTRRDTPDGSLWRLAVEGFNRILVGEVSRGNTDHQIDQSARVRLWKEVADVYEIFLVGSCGRALPSDDLSSTAVKADESLELTVLDVLSDTILKAQSDAPIDILERLVSTLDRCASRTDSVPVESVGLMPQHCSRFSLTCLQKIFYLSSYSSGDEWHWTRSKVSRVSILVLMNRCEYILKQFLIDENDLGEQPLPMVRIEEIIYVLQELARLVIHPDTASALLLPPFLKEGISKNESCNGRAHLFCLFPSFCELVVSREARVRELVQVLLRLITKELRLKRLT